MVLSCRGSFLHSHESEFESATYHIGVHRKLGRVRLRIHTVSPELSLLVRVHTEIWKKRKLQGEEPELALQMHLKDLKPHSLIIHLVRRLISKNKRAPWLYTNMPLSDFNNQIRMFLNKMPKDRTKQKWTLSSEAPEMCVFCSAIFSRLLSS